MLKDLFNGLCEFLNIDPIEPRDDGSYEIVFDDGLAVEMRAITGSHLLIRSSITELPDDPDDWDTCLREHLQGNMLLLREQSNSLSLDYESRTIWLYRTVRSDEIKQYEFNELVGEFVTTLEWWKNRGNQSSGMTSAMDLMPQHFIRP